MTSGNKADITANSTVYCCYHRAF